MRASTRSLVAAGIGIAFVIVILAASFASRSPDGLMRTAADQGFDSSQQSSATAGGPLAGYTTKGLAEGGTSRAVAGIAGCLVVLVLFSGTARVLRRRSRQGEGR